MSASSFHTWVAKEVKQLFETIGLDGHIFFLFKVAQRSSLKRTRNIRDNRCIDRGVDPHAAVAGALHCPLVGEANRRLAELVQSAASGGKFVLTLGGDHSIG